MLLSITNIQVLLLLASSFLLFSISILFRVYSSAENTAENDREEEAKVTPREMEEGPAEILETSATKSCSSETLE